MVSLPGFWRRERGVNLLPKDPFESSLVGVVLSWALETGKWVVIVTQLVVIGVFIYRFSLDRQLTNLRREITQQAAVVNSYKEMEEQFLLTQKRLTIVKEMVLRQAEVKELIAIIQRLTPPEVWYERMSISENSISVSAYAESLSGFSRYLASVQHESRFVGVNVGRIEDGGRGGAEISFEMTLTYQDEEGK